MPQPWAACAKSAAQKLSPTSTTGLETHANAIVLQAPCGVNCDVVQALWLYTRTKEVEARRGSHRKATLFFAPSTPSHEVLPAYVPRLAVTIWYFDGEEHARARSRSAAAARMESGESRLADDLEDFNEVMGKFGGGIADLRHGTSRGDN